MGARVYADDHPSKPALTSKNEPIGGCPTGVRHPTIGGGGVCGAASLVALLDRPGDPTRVSEPVRVAAGRHPPRGLHQCAAQAAQCRSLSPTAVRSRSTAGDSSGSLRAWEAMRSESASASTFSFSWAASSPRREEFYSSTRSSSERTLVTVWSAACHDLRSCHAGRLTSQTRTIARQTPKNGARLTTW